MKKALYLLLFLSFYSFSQNEPENPKKDVDKNKGYFNITKVSFSVITKLKKDIFIEGEGGFFSDLDTGGAHAWGIQTINGYFISPHFSLGIGIGLDGYHEPDFNTLPVVLDIRTYISDDENSIYVYLDVGPNIRLGGDSSEFRKGMALNLGFGYKFNVGENLFLVSDIFYSHKTVSLTNEGIRTSDYVIKANGTGLSLGFIF
ncbi:hypothetical protein [Xanthomarina spongicola]|uniref:Outer membrane protein with beta-barrel domain n=1 Tax=Xanthomarina spongicola TaxID=570520 RepID=A0A316DUS0_9FLAO|nr:hypothetical protein [Xanthomarina spongicola]PWK20323.1 hypothetical protein LX78_00022 [Xanthomarina spongicola]